MITRPIGKPIGTVVGNTSPSEYRFSLKSLSAKLGDLVTIEMQVPIESKEAGEASSDNGAEKVIVWGRIVELERFNPFLPIEAGQELADHGVELLDTVLSHTRDQVEAKVLVLGSALPNNVQNLRPLNYPVSPGAEVCLPPPPAVKEMLVGDENVARLKLGHLIGRSDIDVEIKTNAVVARHMAILAMTGGGKTVAARRVLRELIKVGYPILIFDPHGDYLGLWKKRDLFRDTKTDVKLFFPSLTVKDQTRGVIGYLVAQMTQGFTEPQQAAYEEALEKAAVGKDGTNLVVFINSIITSLEDMKRSSKRHPGTIPAVQRALRIVKSYIETMTISNARLREQPTTKDFEFRPLPDPTTRPHEIVQPGQVSILYLGGYDHLTQSTLVALVLKELFQQRASMRDNIPPLYAVVEEAHNFIPSRSEGQSATPSVKEIRKVMTEGRKFGLGLLLISQRPSRLDETALSQCNTFLIFRLVNPRDQAFVEKVMENLSRADSKLLPAFGPGQGIISGQAVRFPLVIKVGFDKELVSSLGDEDFVRAVKQWTKSSKADAARRSQELTEELNVEE